MTDVFHLHSETYYKIAQQFVLASESLSVMYSRLYILLATLATAAHASIMVKSVDGSFVPWAFYHVRRMVVEASRCV